MSDLNGVPPHEIVIVPLGQSDLRKDCYHVRTQVFHHEQGFPLDTEIDEFDEISIHFLLRLVPSLKPIGTVRTFQPKGAFYSKLSRLAVLKDYRQYKFGRELVLALHSWLKAQSMHDGSIDHVKVVAHSQIPVKAFYAKFGYEPEGEEFDEEGAPHQRMVVRLPLGV